MDLRPKHGRSQHKLPPAVLASWWVGRLTFTALLMVVPGLLGFWFDQQVGSVAAFGIVGFIVGSVLAMRYLLKLTARESASSEQSSGDKCGDK